MGQLARRLVVLGSTGSIGTQTLSVVRSHADSFEVVGLGTGHGTYGFRDQVREFAPRLVSTAAAEPFSIESAEAVSMTELASASDADLIVVAIPGLAALDPTLAAIRAGKDVALASKEALVVAGGLVMAEAARRGVSILPLDSEHNAISQCIRGEPDGSIAGVTLTASGGPFRERSRAEIDAVTPAQALAHPTWKMGPKVTIDSATLMNKGFEVIEAHWLYAMPYERIQVVLHPQSIVHSLVEFVDGSVKAQLSNPDMRLPIQYALAYPGRISIPEGSRRLPITEMGSLTFEPLDEDRYPCFRLAREAAAEGETYPAVLNASDEVAVDLFLNERISFTRIAEIVDLTLQQHQPTANPGLDDLFAADAWAREAVQDLVTARS